MTSTRPFFHVDNVPHTICDGCDAIVTCRDQLDAALPDEGIMISLDGWYGGFVDNVFEPAEKHVLCHDCTLAVYRAVPNLAKQRGLHSTRENVVCCEFQWTFHYDENGNYNGVQYGDGTWKPKS